jgi:hypothetical protein
MEKKRMIGKVYKILEIYEHEPFDNYMTYLTRTICELDGEQCEWMAEYVNMLKGLKNYGNDVFHNEVRTIVLHITNGIDRKYEKEAH